MVTDANIYTPVSKTQVMATRQEATASSRTVQRVRTSKRQKQKI